jgi:hypothetical protein
MGGRSAADGNTSLESCVRRINAGWAAGSEMLAAAERWRYVEAALAD